MNHGIDGLTWRGEIQNGTFRQTASDLDGGTRIVLEITANEDLQMEGASYRLDIPRAQFLGGHANLDGGSANFAGRKIEMLGGVSRTIGRPSASGVAFTASFDRPLPVRIEDRWERNGRFYAVSVEFHHGALGAGRGRQRQAGLAALAAYANQHSPVVFSRPENFVRAGDRVQTAAYRELIDPEQYRQPHAGRSDRACAIVPSKWARRSGATRLRCHTARRRWARSAQSCGIDRREISDARLLCEPERIRQAHQPFGWA